MARKTRNLAICAALLALGGLLTPAAAEPAAVVARADPFSALVGKRDERRDEKSREPVIERYVLAGDARTFLFEGSVSDGRIKFLCGPGDPRLDCKIDPEGPAEEIFTLKGARGSRGEVTYRNSQGDVILRLTSYGGATVFWPGEANGLPAAKSYGEDTALLIPQVDRGAAYRRARAATAHISALTGEPVEFEFSRDVAALQPQPASAPMASFAPAAEARQIARAEADNEPSTDDSANTSERGRRDATVLADAVARVAGGMQQVADDPTGARYLGARVKAVRFVAGSPPSLSLKSGVLSVIYDPLGDLEGRPSSTAVARYLEESL